MTEREGLLDDESVRRVVREAGAPLCYLAGPPGMVTSATAMLQAAGVPAAEIHAEEFFGY